MPNRKWILTSLVMTFSASPILAQFLAAVIAMLGVGLAGIIEVVISLSRQQFTFCSTFLCWRWAH